MYEVVCQHWFMNELRIRNAGPVILHDRTDVREKAEALAASLRVEPHRKPGSEVTHWTSSAVVERH